MFLVLRLSITQPTARLRFCIFAPDLEPEVSSTAELRGASRSSASDLAPFPPLHRLGH